MPQLTSQVPHPLFAKFELRIQTDSEITPKEALVAATTDLIQDLDKLKKNFSAAYQITKLVSGGQNGA